jgi:hypothetical protein
VNPLGKLSAIPLRDIQATPPVACCDGCGGELYEFDPFAITLTGLVYCSTCAREIHKEVYPDP